MVLCCYMQWAIMLLSLSSVKTWKSAYLHHWIKVVTVATKHKQKGIEHKSDMAWCSHTLQQLDSNNGRTVHVLAGSSIFESTWRQEGSSGTPNPQIGRRPWHGWIWMDFFSCLYHLNMSCQWWRKKSLTTAGSDLWRCTTPNLVWTVFPTVSPYGLRGRLNMLNPRKCLLLLGCIIN